MRETSILQRTYLQVFLVNNRFIKFAAVGGSGTVVNLAVLYASQEFLFRHVETLKLRLSLSLALAICISTMNNFLWNRGWTWADRKAAHTRGVVFQLGQYFVACWVSILFQLLFTHLLARLTYYLIANLGAICLAAGMNYWLNDHWTFAIRRDRLQKDSEDHVLPGIHQRPRGAPAHGEAFVTLQSTPK